VIPYTIADYLGRITPGSVDTGHEAFRSGRESVQQRINALFKGTGRQTVNDFHRRLGHIMWEDCGMARSRESLNRALEQIPELRREFWDGVILTGQAQGLNQELEKALRVADFLEFGELLARDALAREESCGGHFRTEYQTEEGEAQRNDADYSHVSAWEYSGEDAASVMHTEPLDFENVQLAVRSYK
jgi:succinate dehydrogenase / fumarate reductase flavoprotein subunit